MNDRFGGKTTCGEWAVSVAEVCGSLCVDFCKICCDVCLLGICCLGSAGVLVGGGPKSEAIVKVRRPTFGDL